MLINNKAAEARLNSPFNLMNKLNSHKSNPRKNAMSLFIPPKKNEVIIPEAKELQPLTKNNFNPFANKGVLTAEENKENNNPSVEQLIENVEDQVQLSLAHNKALELLNNSVNILASKLDDVKADKLPSVISAASKVVESIRRERLEISKTNKEREVHYHFYTPIQKSISEYEVIDVGVAEGASA